MREFYGSSMFKNKTPIQDITTWRQARGVVNNIIEGSFNLKSIFKRVSNKPNLDKEKIELISFVRPINLF